MQISEICIKRPVFSVVLSLMLIAIGLVFFNKLQIRGIPNIDFGVITVSANYPGADALYMERQITTRIEKQLKTIKNIDYISSNSSVGSSNIVLNLKLGADTESVLNDIRSKISAISYIFPTDMKPPSVAKQDADGFPSIWLSVSSDRHDTLELTRIVDDYVKEPLEKLSNVGIAQVFGAKYYTMLIEPDPLKMFQFKITPTDIENALKAQNKDYPAGNIKSSSKQFVLSLNNSFSSKEEFQEVILRSASNSMVKIKDVAKVYLDAPEDQVILRYKGKRGVSVGVIKQSEANIIDLATQVKQSLAKISKNFPPGVTIEVAFDSSIPVDASIKAVYSTIFESLILVTLVTYLFLGSFKITLIPFITIPISLISTFAAMYFLGFTINTFTLLAMILAIGLVVDDAIVMLENIFRHYENGQTPMESAKSAAKEISFAILAMTLTLTAVFLPIGLIPGFIGKLFIEFAWTLAFCVLFSGFVALTLTPMMASRMIERQNYQPHYFLIKFDQYFKFLQNNYLQLLEIIFFYKKKFFMIIAASVAILIISFKFVHKTFVPAEDDGYLQVVYTGPEGSSLENTEAAVIAAEKIFAEQKDLQGYLSVVGNNGSDSAFSFLPLKTWHERQPQNKVKMILNQNLSKIPSMSIFAIDPRSLASGNAQNPIEFNLQTSLEYKDLDVLSAQFITEMKNNPIFINADRDFKASTPNLNIIVDKDKAYHYGVSLEQIGTTIQYLMAGQTIGDFRLGNEIYDVLLQYNKKQRSNPNSLQNITIKTKDNKLLPLQVVAKINEATSVKSYDHYNNSRSVNLHADLNAAYTIEQAVQAINSIAAKIVDNNHTKLEYTGEIQRLNESQNNLIIIFLFAVIFIYLILCAQFESFTDPILILLAVPFSITGGVLTLILAGNSINMYSNIGLLTLIGLITKNSIMIVEFTNQLRAEGLLIQEAVKRACQLRFRPILMTSLATVLGATPLVLASGAGSAARNSIGLVIVGGMIVGTIFTVFVIPVLYQTFKQEK